MNMVDRGAHDAVVLECVFVFLASGLEPSDEIGDRR